MVLSNLIRYHNHNSYIYSCDYITQIKKKQHRYSPSYTVSDASAATASATPFSATHSYGASSRPLRTGSMRKMDRPPVSVTEYRVCVPGTFFPFFRHTIVGCGSPRAEQKKLAMPPARTPTFDGLRTISGGSKGNKCAKLSKGWVGW